MREMESGIYYGYIVVTAVFVIMITIWGTVATFGVFLNL